LFRARVPGDAEHGVRVAHLRPIDSAHDPPGTVRLPAGGSECLFHLAADIDRLLELAAIGAVRSLIGPRRRDRAVVAAVRIPPFRVAAGRVSLQRVVGGARYFHAIGAVERLADLAAGDAAEEGADRDSGQTGVAAPDLRSDECAGAGPDQGSAGLFRASYRVAASEPE